ncbi:MAG: Gldg family protein [Krumholzibacteria bacterium]|nr:Gldg family protein [Candidatus Krumholzibacteria bacterium]
MRQLRAILGREVGSFFHGAVGPVVLVGFLVGVGLFFTLFVLGYSEMSLTAMQSARSGNYLNLAEGLFRPMVSNMTLFLLLLLPAVTMRLFAPDYRSGRWELVASWPVPDLVWVLGKWLAAVAVAAVLILGSGAYFGAVWLLGSPEPGPLVAAWLGLLLYAGCLAAWGVLASTLVGHQILAYFSTFVLGIVLFLVGALERFLPAPFGELCRQFSLLTHFEKFSRGVLDSRDIVWFLAMTAVPLAAAAAVLAGRRQTAQRRLGQAAPVLLVVLVALVAYLAALRLPLVADLTADKRYSLAPQTVQILESLPDGLAALRAAADSAGADTRDLDHVQVTAFYQRLDPARDLTEALLKACTQHTRAFRYRMVDPEEELDLVRQYGVNVSRTIVVAAADRWTSVLQPEEGGLINAVYRLVSGRSTRVLHLLGHGEHLPDSDDLGGYSSYGQLLYEQGYDLQTLHLPAAGRVPPTADVVVIAGPRTEPGDEELAALEEHLRRGGAVLGLFDPPTPDRWRRWLARWRVELTGDVIVAADRAASEFGVGARTVVVGDGYGDHTVSRSLTGVATVFPLAQPLALVGEPDSVVAGAVILRSSELTWAERDPDTRFSGRARYDAGVDVPGPLDFGMVLELALDPEGGRPGRLVVVGNSEFLSNANLNLGGNRDLLLNALGWLAREETLIQLRGRDPLSQPVVLDDTWKKVLGWGSVLGWPLLVGSLAVGVMLRHRRAGGAA